MSKQKNATYHRIDKSERIAIERCLNKQCSCREIARNLERSPSSISYEIINNRCISTGSQKGQRVEKLPDDVCPRLLRRPVFINIIFKSI